MTILLGGAASPIGWSVQYVDADHAEVSAALVAWRRGLGQQVTISDAQPFPTVLRSFLPLEWPWTRELVLPCGGWTAYLNNSDDGGDLTASASHIARTLGVRWVGAESTLPHGPGHQSTQLWVHGPGGEPPLMSERTLSAFAEDGRWSWETSGQPLPFEDLSRYTARRKRDRLDRPLLLEYLRALGIPADDDSAYGAGVVIQRKTDHPPRTVPLSDARIALGLSGMLDL